GPHLRRGQEDRLEGRRGRVLAHPALQPVPAARLRTALAPAACGLLVAVAILLVMPSSLVGVFYDDGIYLSLAKSLAEGNGYHLQYLPGAPAAVHYPIAYPAFLALIWKLW